jgi:hypothetical protein
MLIHGMIVADDCVCVCSVMEEGNTVLVYIVIHALALAKAFEHAQPVCNVSLLI